MCKISKASPSSSIFLVQLKSPQQYVYTLEQEPAVRDPSLDGALGWKPPDHTGRLLYGMAHGMNC